MSDIKISKTVPQKDKKHAELTIEGELTLQNARELKNLIQKEIVGLDSVNIKATNISQADITFIQILRSLKKHLEENGKNITTLIEYPYDVKVLLNNAGFET